eukprot:TRINITY_DN32981_c0_g1_i1.p2 TRINITY_DN32981_c0_g1~~TRINITY_DN32981_c0_g1_i1.p2  ORF type:complete len:105 (+),score=35.33 TRINITY_DN32981_c0_g1_i1:160-474(+)
MASPPQEVIVPHYEPTSSGQTVSSEADLPDWFRKKVAHMQRHDACGAERDALQRCMDDKSLWTVECGRLLEAYDVCQQQRFTPEFRSMAEVNQIRKQLAEEGAA